METLNCKNEIINRALSLLREKEIIDASIEPSNDTEKLIHKWFETAKAECIMEIEPPFAIRRLKLNVEKTVNSETLEEIKNIKNKTIDFKDWMKSVIENDITELQNEIDRLIAIRNNLDDELIKELTKEEQNELQIKYLKKRIKHINLNIIVLKERIRFLSIEYDLKVEIDTIEIDNAESNNNTETDGVETDNKGLLNEEQTPEPPYHLYH